MAKYHTGMERGMGSEELEAGSRNRGAGNGKQEEGSRMTARTWKQGAGCGAWGIGNGEGEAGWE